MVVNQTNKIFRLIDTIRSASIISSWITIKMEVELDEYQTTICGKGNRYDI